VLPDQVDPFQVPSDHELAFASSGARVAAAKGLPKMSFSPC